MTQFADPDTAAAADSGEFLTNEELIGRNLIVVPKSIETIKAEEGATWPDGRPKTDYERLSADIIVLDGRRNSKIRSFPHIERNKYISAFKVVTELRPYVGKQPVVGYFTQVNKAYFLEKADSDGKALAAKAWEVYEAQATQTDEPPF